MVEMDDEYVDAGISEAEENIVQRFLQVFRLVFSLHFLSLSRAIDQKVEA